MNRLFVAYKPPFVSSNAFLHKIKKRYRVKKAGFSGTLDPFACGTLIIAFGAYTKLFRFLQKYPKRYRTTIWLGASSPSLDIEKIESIQDVPPLDERTIKDIINSFVGEFTYIPPLFSAKKVGGKRAYHFAARGKQIDLKPVTSTIEEISFVHYRHPFITFEATVSEGTYIRSLAEAIAKKLGFPGTLSYLERLAEGKFVYENENPLDPVQYLRTKQNFVKKSKEAIFHGAKLTIDDLAYKEDGEYHILFDDFFAIIRVEKKKVRYLLNQIPRKYQ
ncbi:tRNA pseudouridine(55) synthase TruB [Nitratiruptor sp. SB155-2]|uniref:tRNA pseudouridine synthase B n=1 Tax=Nitratiruptor sp. (strain SB155-2) TaxID=387092 RepID=TRUB_NITSB|nr:tRNA pseudouridine(55) synthase TruB [Nitratiruptor sp. SB155-2]A6Q522.1 RecName: Full=tRNA pseudouridine synthase B; AltName: Full=tRNA pseudouridine(55) synthase; Short=Psi55 synthase; AltName: Full=tRNA pseudouridylate synthase; AltName: Full=tRNA-uridine isomerase [Nitratiruptor sp. SB155-2]BAF70581.1 tRNA pseudouridine synthase B [Nitratiruptor sp. SB155-2]